MLLFVALLFSTTGCGSKKESPVVVKVALPLPPTHPSYHALEFFKERLEKESNGRFDVRIFPSSQLGGTTENIEGIRAGNIEVGLISAAPLAQYIPEMTIFSMPFIFRSSEHMFAAINSSAGKKIYDKLEALNMKGVGFFDSGSRDIMTKKGPINKPEDLAGMKIRIMLSKVNQDAITSLGASAIAMDMGEVYSALQTGVIDGWENNPPTAISYRMYETGCIYYAWTRHLSIPDIFVLNKTFYDNLDDDMREILDRVIDETQKKQHQLWTESVHTAIDELTAAGMKFNEVDNKLFKDKVEWMYEKYYNKYGKEFETLCEEIIAIDVN